MKATLLHIYVLVGFAAKFLFSTLWGTLCAVAILYFITRWFTELGTYTWWEIVLWLDSQGENTKALLLSSALTVIGFLVAFQGATRNWRDQIHASVRMQVAAELQAEYNRITLLISALEIYADSHLNLLSRIQQGEPVEEIVTDLQSVLSQSEKFVRERAELAQLNIHAQGLHGKFGFLLFAIDRGMEQLAQINKAVTDVTESMWIAVPTQQVGNCADPIRMYIKQVDKERWNKLSNVCKHSQRFVAANVGYLAGNINGPITETTVGTFLNFIRKGHFLLKSQDAMRRGDEVELDELTR